MQKQKKRDAQNNVIRYLTLQMSSFINSLMIRSIAKYIDEAFIETDSYYRHKSVTLNFFMIFSK